MLCMAPTEYRVIAKRAEPRPLPGLRGLVAAGEALNAEVLRVWEEATGLSGARRLRADRDRAAHRQPARRRPRGRARWAGRCPAWRCASSTASSCSDPATDPTFFLGYLDEPAAPGRGAPGDRVSQDEDGYLFFEGRSDDVIISAGYRIGPFEVESALVAHPAVAEAAVVAAPDDERGSVVRAVVVLRDDFVPGDALASELQDHVKAQTAPYKYPRIVEFAAELPRTPSGKVKRAALRGV